MLVRLINQRRLGNTEHMAAWFGPFPGASQVPRLRHEHGLGRRLARKIEVVPVLDAHAFGRVNLLRKVWVKLLEPLLVDRVNSVQVPRLAVNGLVVVNENLVWQHPIQAYALSLWVQIAEDPAHVANGRVTEDARPEVLDL